MLGLLASIQVSFRVVVRRLRTNNEFKLRVLIYREFTVFLIHFTYKLCVSRAFLYWFFMCFYHILQERCSGAEFKKQLNELQKRASTEVIYGP